MRSVTVHPSDWNQTDLTPPATARRHPPARAPRFIVSLALLAAACLSAEASDPVGIYARVDKVVLEPNETAPERVQIWGAFALAVNPGDRYAPAEGGYLYFEINRDKPALCRNEWADFKRLAGTGQVVAFATRYGAKGRVRPADEKPAAPEAYPLGSGVTKIRDHDYAPVRQVREWRPPANQNGHAALRFWKARARAVPRDAKLVVWAAPWNQPG
jgi:hypothetical protein